MLLLYHIMYCYLYNQGISFDTYYYKFLKYLCNKIFQTQDFKLYAHVSEPKSCKILSK